MSISDSDYLCFISIASLFGGIVLRSIEHTLLHMAAEEDQLISMCQSGIEIDLRTVRTVPTQRIASDNIVCVRGKIYSEDTPLRSFNDRECVVIETLTCERDGNAYLINNAELSMVPWCLASHDTRGMKPGSAVAIDIETCKESLTQSHYCTAADTRQSHPIHAYFRYPTNGGFVNGGEQNIERSWWDFFFAGRQKTILQRILPCLSSCSVIGRLIVDSDGKYTLTAHPSVGMVMFADISFKAVASAREHIPKSLRMDADLVHAAAKIFVTVGLIGGAGQIIFRCLRSDYSPFLSPSSSSNDVPGVGDSDHDNCVVCLDASKKVLLMPCRHLCLCISCAPHVSSCPICRAEIVSKERVYTA